MRRDSAEDATALRGDLLERPPGLGSRATWRRRWLRKIQLNKLRELVRASIDAEETLESDVGSAVSSGTSLYEDLGAMGGYSVGSLLDSMMVQSSGRTSSSKRAAPVPLFFRHALSDDDDEEDEEEELREEITDEKEAADFASAEGELMYSIDTLGRAIGSLSKEMAKNPASFTQLDTRNAEGLSKALSVVLDAAAFSIQDQTKLMALVQSKQSDESDDLDLSASATASSATYNGGILDVLEDRKKKAERQLSDLRKAAVNNKQNSDMLKQQPLEDRMLAEVNPLDLVYDIIADLSKCVPDTNKDGWVDMTSVISMAKHTWKSHTHKLVQDAIESWEDMRVLARNKNKTSIKLLEPPP